jgi:uncharacterized membrane protein YGL010W
MTTSYFERQLGAYSSYHTDRRNRATHFVGIPAIVFSILLALALWRFPLFGFDASAAWIGAIAAVLGWIALDRGVGLAMIVPMLVLLVIAEWLARNFSATTVWIVFAIFFVGGWIFQLGGHVFEGRRPALADNLFQAFIGPMFIMAEVLMAIGLKQELKAVIDSAPHAAA